MNASTNFVKTVKKALRDDSEMDAIRTKKGKLNKPVRGTRQEWVPICTGNQAY
jgi:hypothetical protein